MNSSQPTKIDHKNPSTAVKSWMHAVGERLTMYSEYAYNRLAECICGLFLLKWKSRFSLWYFFPSAAQDQMVIRTTTVTYIVWRVFVDQRIDPTVRWLQTPLTAGRQLSLSTLSFTRKSVTGVPRSPGVWDVAMASPEPRGLLSTFRPANYATKEHTAPEKWSSCIGAWTERSWAWTAWGDEPEGTDQRKSNTDRDTPRVNKASGRHPLGLLGLVVARLTACQMFWVVPETVNTLHLLWYLRLW